MCVLTVGMKPDEKPERTRSKMDESNPLLTGNATDTLVQLQAFKAMSARTTEFMKSFASGAIAGAVAKTTIAPLDRTKIIFQTSSRPFSVKGVLDVLRTTYHKSGFFFLFRGNSATIARIVPYAAIQFSSHEQFKNLLRQGEQRGALPPAPRFLAGSLAGITAASCTYPLDMIRARMAVTGRKRYKNLKSAFSTIYKEEGVRTFYRGFFPTIIGIIPYAGISFFTYETLKKLYYDRTQGCEPPTVYRLGFGAFAGLCGQSTTYPLDIIRRRMQTNGAFGEMLQEYQSITSTFKYVLKIEGVKRGLYKGLSMNWVKGPIAVGISFTTYDLMQQFFKHHTMFPNTTDVHD